MSIANSIAGKGSKAYSLSARELAGRGYEHIPAQMISGEHLIYSSPATLAFNSPGAEGYGVKRAGLAVPGSVMLVVAPGCCGRNTSLISRMPAYDHRFFYLVLHESDVVTGKHLRMIPQAVEEIIQDLDRKPSVVMICITCVDALLGTDMDRVCRQAEERVHIPVRPCYMYALTREGRKPPMVHVRQSIYSLLEKRPKRSNVVNLLGYFEHLEDDSELYPLLRSIGIKTVHEIGRCSDYDSYLKMAEANFNLVLNPEARAAAADFEKKLEIPSIEMTRLYQTDKLHAQYQALGHAIGAAWDDTKWMEEASNAARAVRKRYGKLQIALGECMNGDPFEMALALISEDFEVTEIYGTVSKEKFPWIRRLASVSPDTLIYSNLEPTMLYYDASEREADLTIGKDAGFYHPDCPNLPWNQDIQPFGHVGVRHLYEEMDRMLASGEACR